MTGKPELDIQVRMTGAIGADEYGQRSIARLAEAGVDISGIRTVKGQATGVSVIIIESDFGENRILETQGANLSNSLPNFSQ